MSRPIKPETICIGDTIRTERVYKGVKISEVSTIASRDHSGRFTSFLTAEGGVAVELIAGAPYPRKVYLLSSRADMLDGMENI